MNGAIPTVDEELQTGSGDAVSEQGVSLGCVAPSKHCSIGSGKSIAGSLDSFPKLQTGGGAIWGVSAGNTRNDPSLNQLMPSSPNPYYPPQCQICEFYTHNPHLRCTLHPLGLESEECLDFEAIFPLPEPEEQWQPEGAAYYNGDLVLQPRQRPLTEQLDLLDTHPLFTG